MTAHRVASIVFDPSQYGTALPHGTEGERRTGYTIRGHSNPGDDDWDEWLITISIGSEPEYTLVAVTEEQYERWRRLPLITALMSGFVFRDGQWRV